MTTEEFRTRAANCLRWAQEAVNERTKELWLNMALIWLDRAENPHWIQISQEDHAGRQLTFRTPTMWRQDGDRRSAMRWTPSLDRFRTRYLKRTGGARGLIGLFII